MPFNHIYFTVQVWLLRGAVLGGERSSRWASPAQLWHLGT